MRRVAILIVGLVLGAPGLAHASVTVEPIAGCNATVGGGQRDSNGNVYIACGDSIQVYGAGGSPAASVPTSVPVSDVAPNADGSQLYVTSFDIAGPDTQVVRLTRQLDGSYATDGAWPAAINGSFIATDSSGYLYVAERGAGRVAKYRSDGTVVTSFVVASGLSGVAVSRDGRSAYTTETVGHRVQRWSRRSTGSYRLASSYTGFRTPIDIGVDSAGNFATTNSTSSSLRFTSSLGATIADYQLGGTELGIAVTSGGTAYVAAAGMRATWAPDADTPTAPPADSPTSPTTTPSNPSAPLPPPPPPPDVTKPTIHSIGTTLRLAFSPVTGLHERIYFPVRVSEYSTVTSTLTLPTRPAAKKSGKKRPAQVLGSGTVKVAGGKSTKAMLRLNLGGRRYLRKAPRRQTVILRITVKDAAGNMQAATRRLRAGSIR